MSFNLFVRGNSLSPFLLDGDEVTVFPEKPIRRFNLITYTYSPEQNHIKICMGIPGDTLELKDSNLIINKESKIPLQNEFQVYCWKDWIKYINIIPEDHYIVLGTIPESIDSRSKGFILKENILGVSEKC